MPRRSCETCGTRMKPEYDRDFECLIWVCPECGRQDVEGGCE